MQLLQHDATGDFSISLTNQFIRIDVVLNDFSISGYEYMGFNVKPMTQDVHQGQFTITTENPIPLMRYSDRFTWAKYGHFILYSGLIPVHDKSLMNQNFAVGFHEVSLTENHRECLVSFLQTDPDGAASFVVDARSARLIEDFLKNTFRDLTKGTEKGYFFDEVMETNADSIVSSICAIAMEATKIPLAIFTDLFHHRFKKKLYLESTLELLQQFYIQLVDHSNHFCIFVGDHHKYCLHCARCHCALTRLDNIQCILEMAPAAMLSHLEIASDVEDFHHGPIVLPCPESMDYSWTFLNNQSRKLMICLTPHFYRAKQLRMMGCLVSVRQRKLIYSPGITQRRRFGTKHTNLLLQALSLLYRVCLRI